MAARFASRLLGAAAVAALLAKDVVASNDLDAELLEGLASDEVCQGEDAEACSLELRQLRAQERKAEVSKHQQEQKAKEEEADEGEEEPEGDEPEPVSALQVDASFGPENEGTNMWQETTWNDILLEFQSKVNSSNNCGRDTGGSCSMLSCSQTRGPTQCFGHKCTCPVGFCAFQGSCFPSNLNSQCESNTGGTCSIGSCSSSRGLTKCKSGSCLCKTGGCAWMGKCWPITNTGGSCSLMSCASWRGATCHRGRCICQNGYVALHGKCVRYDP